MTLSRWQCCWMCRKNLVSPFANSSEVGRLELPVIVSHRSPQFPSIMHGPRLAHPRPRQSFQVLWLMTLSQVVQLVAHLWHGLQFT